MPPPPPSLPPQLFEHQLMEFLLSEWIIGGWDITQSQQSSPFLQPIPNTLLETLVAAVIYISCMPERKPWSEREDEILR